MGQVFGECIPGASLHGPQNVLQRAEPPVKVTTRKLSHEVEDSQAQGPVYNTGCIDNGEIHHEIRNDSTKSLFSLPRLPMGLRQ